MVGKWSISGRWVVGRWSASGRQVIGKWSAHSSRHLTAQSITKTSNTLPNKMQEDVSKTQWKY